MISETPIKTEEEQEDDNYTVFKPKKFKYFTFLFLRNELYWQRFDINLIFLNQVNDVVSTFLILSVKSSFRNKLYIIETDIFFR